MLVFIIVGKSDKPIYELELSDAKADTVTSAAFPSPSKKDEAHLSHFVLHAALDIVDETVWKNQNIYLRVVEKYGNLCVSAFVTCGHMKFLLLHNNKNDELVKNFFTEVYELYLKILMNPFYQVNSPITSKVFHERVQTIAQKRLL